MIRFLCVLVLYLGSISISLSADEPKVCGGVGGVDCGADQFCNYPVGTCGAADAQGECQEIPDICPTDWKPVVGCDGRLYSNSCVAAGAGVSVKHPYSEPRVDLESDLTEATQTNAASNSGQIRFAGKVRADGSIEHRKGQWTLENVSQYPSEGSVGIRVRFSRSVRNAVIIATPFCSFSDHRGTPAAYGYFDDRAYSGPS